MILWLFARLTVIAVLAAAATSYGGAASPMSEGASALLPLWTPIASSSLLLIDLRRRKELSLLHNLGVATSQAVAVGTMPAIMLEALLLMIAK